MDKKKRLGRGLDDVADLWLSSPSVISDTSEPAVDDKTGFTKKTISIIYPELTKVKALLVTNLALELAKQGFGSCILDYEGNGSQVKLMIGNLFQNTSLSEKEEKVSDAHHVVRLYGMPCIHVFSSAQEHLPKGHLIPFYNDSLYSQLTKDELRESLIFLYHQDSLEFITTMKALPPIVLLISKARRESLLIAYAYIKMIYSRNPDTRILIIMDEIADKDEAVKAFRILSEKTHHFLPYLHFPIEFLGSIVHDQALGISLATHFPLVLSEENSLAKQSIIYIAGNLVQLIETLEKSHAKNFKANQDF